MGTLNGAALRFLLFSVLLLSAVVVAKFGGGFGGARGISVARAGVGARGGGGGFRGGSGAGAGRMSGVGSLGSRPIFVWIGGGHCAGCRGDSNETVEYELLEGFATPNRTKEVKKALAAEIRKKTGGVDFGESYVVEERRYYWSRSLLLAQRNQTNITTTTAAPVETTTSVNGTAQLQPQLCSQRILPEDRIWGFLFGLNVAEDIPTTTERSFIQKLKHWLIEEKTTPAPILRTPSALNESVINDLHLYFMCKAGDFCCKFECCPPAARKYDDGFYTMKVVEKAGFFTYLLMIMGIMAMLFLLAALDDKNKKLKAQSVNNRNRPPFCS